jgi:class 3 adenylate cyclase/tetratricopeptide (TPR) repeat protein
MRCPDCGNENRAEARFCDSCGATLAGAPEQQAAADTGATAAAPPASAPTATPQDLPGPLAGGRYRPERFLGQGGRKRVYLARSEDGGTVAVALFETEGVGETVLARARREAKAVEKLGDHPHIVGVLESGEDGGRPYIVSEHMPGGDVGSLLEAAEGRRLELDRALAIAGDVCRALEHAHGCGIVHRDLKPANIWLGEDGRARLGDFGLALTQGGDSRAGEEGGLVGTVAYLPPEQALGRPAGARSDLYSLGALLYEMLTGQPPFPGDDAVAIISQHLSAAPVRPSKLRPDLPPALDELVLALLAKRPEDRPATAAEVRRELLAVAAAPAPAAEPEGEREANPLDRLAGGVFVGRERELRELRASVDEAREGSGGLLLLVGEPGIGKTRTAEELATYAQVNGARVHWGRCHEGEGAPAYWPWAEAIRSYVREADPVGLAWELGTGAAEVARIVPELRERLGSVPEPGDPASEEARFRLFDSVTGFLAAAARSRPLVVVLDDLHWADEPSLLLLRFLARSLSDSGLLVVGTYRDVELGRHHPLARTLSELSGTDRTRRVHLRGLDEEAIGRYVEMSAGQAPPPGLAAAVLEQTEGNPFFVSEVVRLLASEGSLERAGAGGWRPEIPQGVREVVGRRLDRLSEPANAVLTVAAAVGREFSLDVLGRACETCDRAQVEEAVLEAVAARVVAPCDGSTDRYSFSHALVRETLYAEIPVTRRAGVHGRIADALEELHGDETAGHLSELAYHFVEAAPAGDPARAADYARRAAREATDRLAHEDAVSHLERARDVLELMPSPDRRLRLELLLELGEAETKASRYDSARATLHAAASLARELGEERHFARALVGIGEISESGVVDRELIALVEHALEGAGAEPGPLRSQLLTALATELYWEDPTAADKLTLEALEMARQVGDDRGIAQALARRQFLAGNEPEGARRRLEEADELLELAQRMSDPDLEVRVHAYRIRAYLELGEVAPADRSLADYERLAGKLRQPQHLWHVPLLRATRALMDGRFDEAERLGEEALAGGERAGEPLALQFWAVQRALLLRHYGRIGEIRPAVAQMVERFPAVPAWRCALANLEAELGDVEGARRAYEPLAADDFAGIPYDSQWMVSLALIADVAAFLDDEPRAEQLYELLLPYEGLNVVAGRAAASYGPVAARLGKLAWSLGRLDDAQRHLEQSVAMCLRTGERPFAARGRWELAKLLLERGGADDRERALELLAQSLDAARELGMRTLVEWALSTRLEAQGLAGIDVTTSIDSVIEAVSDERPDLSAHVAPDGTVTILFSDIEDSTLMTERLGDERWLEVLRAHNTLFRRRLREHGGYEVKSQGDGFMLVFREPERALACAVAIQRDLDEAEVAGDERVRVRMGLHTGQAIREEGDIFGRSVILAARIAGQARGGEILVSSPLREAAQAGGNGFEFDQGRELELKGLAGRHRVYRAEWRATAEVG